MSPSFLHSVISQAEAGNFLCPVVVYPKEKLMALARLLKKAELETGSQKEFTTAEEGSGDRSKMDTAVSLFAMAIGVQISNVGNFLCGN